MNREFLVISLFAVLVVAGCCLSEPYFQTAPLEPGTFLVSPTATVTTSVGTPTPILPAAISSSDANEVLERFARDNGVCQFPCVLGLTPGKSDQSAIDSFSHFFVEHATERKEYTDFVDITDYIEYVAKMEDDSVEISGYNEGDRGWARLVFWENRISVDFSLGYHLIEGKLNQITLSIGAYEFFGEYIGDNARVLYVHPYYGRMVRSFQLSSVLSAYGPPAEVMIRPFPTDPDYPPAQVPFDFVLFYPERGFLVEYISVRNEADGHFIGCPTKSHISISTWDPNKPLSLLEAVRYFSDPHSIHELNVSYFKPLEDVTTLTVMEFHKTFSNPDYDECVQTPAELWPEQ